MVREGDARIRNPENPPDVAIQEPSESRYYQPIWTLVGAGVFDREVSRRPEADYIPPGTKWIRDSVAAFEPENNTVVTKGVSASRDVLEWHAPRARRITPLRRRRRGRARASVATA